MRRSALVTAILAALVTLALAAAACAAFRSGHEAPAAAPDAGGVAATGPGSAGTAPAASAGIPADSLGLAPGDLHEDPAPEAHAPGTAEPGEAPLPERAYEGAPPVIPHSIADFPPITLEENACLMCHQVEEKVEGEATPVPRSHYIDMRNDPGTAGSEVTGARYRCTACHVPQTNAAPLVGNRFQSR